MPVINEYHSRPVSITPTGRGMQEWETTARRVGPLYNAAAQDVRERGKLAGDEIQAEGWQLNFLKAYHQLRQENEDEAQRRLDALKPPEVRISYGKGHGGGGGYPGGSSGTAGGIIGGAVGLSDIASPYGGRSAPNGSPGSKLYDANTGEFKRSSGGGIYGPAPFKDELQRDLASDPKSYDDLTKRLTGQSNTEYEQDRYIQGEIDLENSRNSSSNQKSQFDNLSGQLAPGAKQEDMSQPWSPYWNPMNWIPTMGADSPTVTQGREDIR